MLPIFCVMTRPALIILASALLATPAVAAETDTGFGSLWTGWNAVARDAIVREREEADRVRQDLARADARRIAELRNQGRDLGERVGEVVRLGDCEGGERMAREAGDFALVEAVRAHCGSRPAA